MKSIKFALLAGALVALAGCVSGPQSVAVPDTLLGRADAVMRGAHGQGSVRLAVSPEEVKVGQPMSIDVAASAPGYLYVYQISTDGKKLNLLFPNSIDGANYVQGATRLPRAGWRIVAGGPAGVGYFMAVVTAQPQDLLAVAARANENTIAVSGPYAATLTSFRESN